MREISFDEVVGVTGDVIRDVERGHLHGTVGTQLPIEAPRELPEMVGEPAFGAIGSEHREQSVQIASPAGDEPSATPIRDPLIEREPRTRNRQLADTTNIPGAASRAGAEVQQRRTPFA